MNLFRSHKRFPVFFGFILAFITAFLPGTSLAQNRIHDKIADLKKNGTSRQIPFLSKKRSIKTGFQYHKKNGKRLTPPVPAEGIEFNLDQKAFDLLLVKPGDPNEWLEIPMTLPQDQAVTLEIYRATPSGEVRVIDQNKLPLPHEKSATFRGVVAGYPESIVSFTVFPSRKIMGFVSLHGEVYDFGNIRPSSKAPRPDVDFSSAEEEPISPDAIIIQETGSLDTGGKPCASAPEASAFLQPPPSSSSGGTDAPLTSSAFAPGVRPVRVSMVTDHDLYLRYNSNSTNLTNFVTGLFNQVATLYAAEGIAIEIGELQIFTTPDPWATLKADIESFGFLTNFSNYMYNNGNLRFTGDLAHLITARPLNLGGVAYRGVLCWPQYSYGFSNIYNFYSTAPTFSWSVEVITHEIGHNLGSHHTHACKWTVNGVANQALDGCFTPEGTCTRPAATTAKGTIMSYCHVTDTNTPPPGIDFNKGFGQQPGDLIRNIVNNISCLRSGTPTPSPNPSPSPSATPAPSASPNPSPSPSATPAPSASPNPSPSPSATPNPSPSPSSSPGLESGSVSFNFGSDLLDGKVSSWSATPISLVLSPLSAVSKIEYFINNAAVCTTVPVTGVCSVSFLTKAKTYTLRVRVTSTSGTAFEKSLSLRGE